MSDGKAAADTAQAPPKTQPRRVKKRKVKRSNDTAAIFLVVLVSFLTCFVILSLAVAAVFAYVFNSVPSESTLYAVTLKSDNKTKASLSASQANKVYGLYIPYSKLATIADIGIVGDDDKISLICLPDHGMIGCRSNSTLITVNGTAVRLSVPVLFENNDYLLPIELIENYVFGITVEYTESSRLCLIKRNTDDPPVTLKMTAISELQKSYFPESYKVYE